MEPAAITSSSPTTNWRVFHGALETSITVESSISPIEDSAVSPLLLVPFSPDSGPCDITISFAQKHEIRQVYVRSTARVYEIYYASSRQSSNEYLCTVRCSAAFVEDLNENSEEELPKKSNELLGEEKGKSDSNIGTSEEEWVEVNAPGSSLHNSTNSSLSSKSDSNSVNSKQELYEATAEINDAEPCTSITLRMLSLQDKGCVYVDEIYVFADPVDSVESDDQKGKMENSTGSSLMAMLVPTLLQLSKTGISRVQDQSTSDMVKSKIESSVADHKEVKVQEHIATHIPDVESNSDSTSKQKEIPGSYFERSMDQLVGRMSRIEDMFLRFEEKMVKPIYTIDARLQRVEQQIELLAKNTQSLGSISGTRFYAPEFSGFESGSSSFYNDGHDNPNVGASGSDTRSTLFCKERPPCSNDACTQVNSTGVVSSLVVTAPEFSNTNDDEEIYESESMVDAPSDKPLEAELPKIDVEEICDSKPLIDSLRDEGKKAVSIGDALASALAGLLSSTTINPHQNPQTFTVKAPDFPNNEDSNEATGSPSVIPDETECFEGILHSPCNAASSENECLTTESPNIADFEKAKDESRKEKCGDDDDQCCHVLTPSKKEVNDTSLEPFDEDVAESGCDEHICSQIVPADNRLHDEDILHISWDLPLISHKLDFEAPILNVRFINSQEHSDAVSPLEALLGNTLEPDDEEDDLPSADKSDDEGALVVDYIGAIGTATSNDGNVGMLNSDPQFIDSYTKHEEEGPLFVENSDDIGTTTCNDLFGDVLNDGPQIFHPSIDQEEFWFPYYPRNSHELPSTRFLSHISVQIAIRYELRI